MVSKGPVDVQVDLFDLRRVQSGLLLHFLRGNKEPSQQGQITQSWRYLKLSEVAKIKDVPHPILMTDIFFTGNFLQTSKQTKRQRP